MQNRKKRSDASYSVAANFSEERINNNTFATCSAFDTVNNVCVVTPERYAGESFQLVMCDGPLNLHENRIDITELMMSPRAVSIDEVPLDELFDLLDAEEWEEARK